MPQKKYTNKLHLLVKKVYWYGEHYVVRISEHFHWVSPMCSVRAGTYVFLFVHITMIVPLCQNRTHFLNLKYVIFRNIDKKMLRFPCLWSTATWSASFPKNGKIGCCLLAGIRVIRVRGDPLSAENRVNEHSFQNLNISNIISLEKGLKKG